MGSGWPAGPPRSPVHSAAHSATTVYRLVQEALSNVAKHARANRVRVTVAESEGELLIEVQDDGAGYDTSASSGGFGLMGMRERVELAGGELSVDSGEQGTIVRASLPTLQGVRSRHEQAAS